MFCITCSKEIIDGAVICRYCGCLTGAPQPIMQEKIITRADKVEVVKVVLSVIIPIVGIVLGAINLKDGKKRSGRVYLIVGSVVTVIEIILTVIYFYFFMVMFFPFLLM